MTSIDATILICLSLLVAIGFVLSYLYLKHQYGDAVAKRLLPTVART
jgi:hypothetical protein